MSDYNTKTKLSIGRYSNGLYTVLGFCINGVIYGMIVHSFWTFFKRCYLVKEQEFLTIYPFRVFRRRKNWFKRNKTKYQVEQITELLYELSDYPACCWLYKESLLETSTRKVLTEKFNRSKILSYYTSLNSFYEFVAIQAICRKYGKCAVVNVR